MGLPSAVGTLAVTVIEPGLRGFAVGGSWRRGAVGLVAAGWVAVLLTAIAAGANPEQRLALPAPTNARPEKHVPIFSVDATLSES